MFSFYLSVSLLICELAFNLMFKDFVMGFEKMFWVQKCVVTKLNFETLLRTMQSFHWKKDIFLFAFYRAHKCCTRPHSKRNESVSRLHTLYSRTSLILPCRLRSWYKLLSCLQTSRVKLFIHFSFPHINCDTFPIHFIVPWSSY